MRSRPPGATRSVAAIASGGKLADRLDLGLHVHRDQDIELVFDCRHEVHHGKAVPLEIARERRSFRQRHALLVERLDLLCNLGEYVVALAHRDPLGMTGPLAKRMRRRCDARRQQLRTIL
jgi:hypothetical protein